jgi:CDP-glucose 4,6-dehydratase
MAEEFWNKRRAFVTGATGFVGAHVAGGLIQRGAMVVCLERDESRPNALDLLEHRSHLTVVNGAVEDYSLIERILNEYEIDTVFHLAAQTLVSIANQSPLSTFESNIRGTYSLLEACRRTPRVTRIVVASSDKAYGTHALLPYTEDYPLLGLYPYDASKVCTDVLARSFAHTYKMPIAVTRFANIYGPADLNLSRIIPGTILSVLRDERPIIRSDGTPVREFVFVDDVVRGYLMLAENSEQFRGEAFNLGAGDQIQMLELVNHVIRIAGKDGQLTPDVLLKSKIEREIDQQFLSSEKVEQRLGWKPEVQLDEGLRRTVYWYRDHLKELS